MTIQWSIYDMTQLCAQSGAVDQVEYYENELVRKNDILIIYPYTC